MCALHAMQYNIATFRHISPNLAASAETSPYSEWDQLLGEDGQPLPPKDVLNVRAACNVVQSRHISPHLVTTYHCHNRTSLGHTLMKSIPPKDDFNVRAVLRATISPLYVLRATILPLSHRISPQSRLNFAKQPATISRSPYRFLGQELPLQTFSGARPLPFSMLRTCWRKCMCPYHTRLFWCMYHNRLFFRRPTCTFR